MGAKTYAIPQGKFVKFTRCQLRAAHYSDPQWLQENPSPSLFQRLI